MLFHWHVLTRTIEPAAYVKLYHVNFAAFEIAMHITKLNCVIKFNYEEVYTHVSCGTASMWDCFEHWGMKLFLISDKLWCNSASFASKDIVSSKCHLTLYRVASTKRSHILKQTYSWKYVWPSWTPGIKGLIKNVKRIWNGKVDIFFHFNSVKRILCVVYASAEKCSNITNEILNVKITAEWTFNK